MFAVLSGILLLSTKLTGEVFGSGSDESYKQTDKRELKLQEVVENPISDIEVQS